MEVDSNLIDEFKELTKESVDFSKKCGHLVQELNSGHLTIVQLVEQLGGLLVDKSPNNRELGTWVLTKVLEALPQNHFNENQLQFICAFYTDRLKDHHQVIPAVLAGIVALAKFDNFPKEAAAQILTALFQNVSCQQQQEQDRANIYQMFNLLLDKCPTELCAMNYDYVYGVISAIDGERNPKNLIKLFNWYPKFVKTVTLGHLTEEAFEVVACYFPVDFKAPTNDTNAITRDQLADSLAPCLTAIPQFSEFCFPLALEKLDATLEIAKIDSLKLLEVGCSTFDRTSYIQHSTEMWSQIQKELFNNPSPETETACLKTLTSVMRKVSDDPSVNGTVKDISDTVKGNLLPDSKLFDASFKILLSVAAASRVSCELITKEIAPILVNSFNITTTPMNKVKFLNCLIQIFICYVNFFNCVEFGDLSKVPVLCLKSSLDENKDLSRAGFEGLSQICKFLPEDIKNSLINNLGKMLLIPERQDVRDSILNCLRTLGESYPNEVQEKLVNNLEIDNERRLELYLRALCVIVPQAFFTQTVINILVFYLQKDVNFGKVVITTLKNIVSNFEDNMNVHNVLMERNIIGIVIDWFLNNENYLDQQRLENISLTLKYVIGQEPTEKQKEIIDRELPKVESNSKRIFILDGLVSHLRRDVKIDYKILGDLTDAVLTENTFTKNAAVQLLANIVNKCSDDNVISSYLSQFEGNKTDLTLMAWITKALVMRNHPLANSWTDKLIQILDADKSAAACFRIIINDSYDSLSLKSYCIRNPLYQQKIFTVVSNKLCEKYQPGCDSYLLAMGYLLEGAPKQVILLQFKKILKLIIVILECQETEILVVLLQIIKDLIVNKEKCIEDHLGEFLTRLLKLSKFEKSMKVRILALQCLQESAYSFPVYKLLMHKQEVLQVLGKVIDDRKRIVRREAVEARSAWFLIDAPI